MIVMLCNCGARASCLQQTLGSSRNMSVFNYRWVSERIFRLVVPILAVYCCFPRPAWAIDLPDNAALQQELERIRAEHSIPGIAAAVIFNRQLQRAAVAGVRKYGRANAVELSDPFDLGSISKPITATLTYVLAEKGLITPQTRIIDVFPELGKKMRPEYREVSVEMLLSHLSAMPYQPKREPPDHFRSASKNMKRRRYLYVRSAVRDAPEGQVGQHYVYSGGSIIVAAMLERITGRRWEQLVRKYVFGPLNMRSAGFGSPSKAGRITGVWEHYWNNGDILPVKPSRLFADETHAPAGSIHASLADMSGFMLAHFPYSGSSLLSRRSLLAMQKRSWYAPTSPGWFGGYDEWGAWRTVWHYGDNLRSIASFVFSPKREAGYITMANISGDSAWEGLHELNSELEAYLLEILPGQGSFPKLGLAQIALSYGKQATASNVFYNMQEYQPDKALDGSYETRWATDDGVSEAWLEIDLGQAQTVRSLLIKEEFAPRVSAFSIRGRVDEAGDYQKLAEGGEIGDELLIRLAPATVRFVRLELKVAGDAGPTISEFQVFGEALTEVY
jgi:CubicO group peptidase (beta-lactamase class C family)